MSHSPWLLAVGCFGYMLQHQHEIDYHQESHEPMKQLQQLKQLKINSISRGVPAENTAAPYRFMLPNH
jgi:hypothetical protein